MHWCWQTIYYIITVILRNGKLKKNLITITEFHLMLLYMHIICKTTNQKLVLVHWALPQPPIPELILKHQSMGMLIKHAITFIISNEKRKWAKQLNNFFVFKRHLAHFLFFISLSRINLLLIFLPPYPFCTNFTFLRFFFLFQNQKCQNNPTCSDIMSRFTKLWSTDLHIAWE